MIRAAVQVNLLIEGDGAENACDAKVVAVDGAGNALGVERTHVEGCTYSVYGGAPASVTVTATRDGYVPASKTITLEKDRCGVKLEVFRLTLKRAAGAEPR